MADTAREFYTAEKTATVGIDANRAEATEGTALTGTGAETVAEQRPRPGLQPSTKTRCSTHVHPWVAALTLGLGLEQVEMGVTWARALP